MAQRRWPHGRGLEARRHFLPQNHERQVQPNVTQPRVCDSGADVRGRPQSLSEKPNQRRVAWGLGWPGLGWPGRAAVTGARGLFRRTMLDARCSFCLSPRSVLGPGRAHRKKAGPEVTDGSGRVSGGAGSLLLLLRLEPQWDAQGFSMCLEIWRSGWEESGQKIRNHLGNEGIMGFLVQSLASLQRKIPVCVFTERNSNRPRVQRERRRFISSGCFSPHAAAETNNQSGFVSSQK